MNIKHNIQLQSHNSLRTKAIAKLFCEPQSINELREILQNFPNEKKLILGKGCNLFFTKDFDGIVIKPALYGINILSETDDFVEIEAGAAEDWDNFVAFCVSSNYAGIENLSYIPGTVGAAPVQNIGAYGVEAKDVITGVKAIEIDTRTAMGFSGAMCQFGYRDSIFKQTGNYVITSVVFRLKKSFRYQKKYIDLNNELEGISNPTLLQVREAVIRVRTKKLPDPEVLANAGSFFKNPILSRKEKDKLLEKLPEAPIYSTTSKELFKTSAAYLIEKIGYKGKRVCDVGIYEHHALIIVNYGAGSGKNIVDFMHDIQHKVRRQFAIQLETEVQVY